MTNILEIGIRKSLLMMILSLGSTAVVTHALADTLIIQGSTTFARRLMEPHKTAIEADSKHELTLIPNKSMPGLIALMEGRAHMAMISASLKSEIDALQKIRPGLAYDRLQAHEILNTRIAVAVHPSNPVRKASLNQVQKNPAGRNNELVRARRCKLADPRRSGWRRWRCYNGYPIRIA